MCVVHCREVYDHTGSVPALEEGEVVLMGLIFPAVGFAGNTRIETPAGLQIGALIGVRLLVTNAGWIICRNRLCTDPHKQGEWRNHLDCIATR